MYSFKQLRKRCFGKVEKTGDNICSEERTIKLKEAAAAAAVHNDQDGKGQMDRFRWFGLRALQRGSDRIRRLFKSIDSESSASEALAPARTRCAPRRLKVTTTIHNLKLDPMKL